MLISATSKSSSICLIFYTLSQFSHKKSAIDKKNENLPISILGGPPFFYIDERRTRNHELLCWYVSL
jgi:hypothetical protein